jgi:hypothetical protein
MEKAQWRHSRPTHRGVRFTEIKRKCVTEQSHGDHEERWSGLYASSYFPWIRIRMGKAMPSSTQMANQKSIMPSSLRQDNMTTVPLQGS